MSIYLLKHSKSFLDTSLFKTPSEDFVLITNKQRDEILLKLSQGFSFSVNPDGSIAYEESKNDPQQTSVTRAQGKAALIKSGLWSSVVDYMQSIGDATEKSLAEVAINDTTHWQRSSPFLNAAAQAIGLTSEQLDQLFIDASKIEL